MKRANQVLVIISAVLLLLFTLFANTQVLYRYVLELPLPWIEELARYVMILMVFIMSGVAIFRRSHLNVEVLDLIMKKKALRVVDKFRLIVISVFTVCFTLLSFQYLQGVIETGQVSPALRISMGIPLSALLIGGIIMTINSLYLLFFERNLDHTSETEMRNSQ